MEYQQWHGCQNVSSGATDSNLNTREKRGGEGTQAELTFFNRIQGNKDCAVHAPNYNRINNHICISSELKLQLPSQPFAETHCLNSKIYSTTVDSATFVMRDENVGRWTRSQCTKRHLPKGRRPEEWHKNPHLKTCRHLQRPPSKTLQYDQTFSHTIHHHILTVILLSQNPGWWKERPWSLPILASFPLNHQIVRIVGKPTCTISVSKPIESKNICKQAQSKYKYL